MLTLVQSTGEIFCRSRNFRKRTGKRFWLTKNARQKVLPVSNHPKLSKTASCLSKKNLMSTNPVLVYTQDLLSASGPDPPLCHYAGPGLSILPLLPCSSPDGRSPPPPPSLPPSFPLSFFTYVFFFFFSFRHPSHWLVFLPSAFVCCKKSTDKNTVNCKGCNGEG